MRAAGETPLPATTHLDSAEDFSIPSRDHGRSIPCRILRPQGGKPAKSVFMHVHGGGWVLQDEKSQDSFLQSIANATGILCLSIGYRLAPECPWPAGPRDCEDSAEWLVDNSEKAFGAPLGFMGGDSAGAHLSVLTVLHLLQHEKKKYSQLGLKGLVLNYGAYDLTFTPQAYTFAKPVPLVLNLDIMMHYVEVFLPGMTAEERKHPSVSPLYAQLYGLTLPPALFTCGTEDCLLDDTVFMSAKWMMAGGETIVKIFPGAPHGYIMFPPEVNQNAKDGLDAVFAYIKSKLAS